MLLRNWFENVKSSCALNSLKARRRSPLRKREFSPCFQAAEVMEERRLLSAGVVATPSAAINGAAAALAVSSNAQGPTAGDVVAAGKFTFQQINLVSDQAGVAQNLDPTLVNAWGISAAPNSGAFWVSSNGGGLSELYLGDVNGSALTQPFKVTIPGGSPTGQVFNINQPAMGTGNSTDFSVTDGTNTGASVFLFASKTGAITGWNPGVGTPMPTAFGPLSTEAEVGFQATDGAVFTGLAAGDVGTAHFLYAADFHNGTIDVVDGQFHNVALGANGFGTFTDPHLSKGFAPFNVQNLGGKLYVTYAQQDAARDGGSVAGHGKGFVDVFDTSGHLLQRVATRGQLDAPWGVAIAPSGFGKFGGDLLVGNFGDGHIDAYDPTHHFAFAGQLKGADGKPVTISGLWGLQFGNGASAGDANSLYFSAGPAHGTHGLFGSLHAVPGHHHDNGDDGDQ
ncbi:MAG TPA: TIGR03118 family protein [Pirellulales bacterium]|jgi:uncharacterized protein (TIGR03118 family)|nr:TIGR03118 family protein [Pirellulales bacterium]